jgi:hypothetical protein
MGSRQRSPSVIRYETYVHVGFLGLHGLQPVLTLSNLGLGRNPTG